MSKWEMVKLGDVLISQPKSKIKAGEGSLNGEYKFFTSSNVQSKFYDKATYDKPALIFGTGGSASVHYCDEPFSTSTDCIVFYAKDKQILKTIFLYLSSKMQILEDGFKGAGLKHIAKEYILNISLKIPIDEQKRIANELDKITALIAKRKTQLEKLDLLVKSRFVEMFGTLENPSQEYRISTLKELCYKITDGKHGGCAQEEGTGRYFVGAREIFDDEVHYNTAPEINLIEFEKDYKRCNIEIGDFLIVNTGATIGKSAIAIDIRTEHTLLQKSVALLKVKKNILNTVFLKWCYRVNTSMYMVASASAQPNLLLSKINATKIYVPDIVLQTQFATFVAQVDKSKFEIQQSLEKLETLKKARMQFYFE